MNSAVAGWSEACGSSASSAATYAWLPPGSGPETAIHAGRRLASTGDGRPVDVAVVCGGRAGERRFVQLQDGAGLLALDADLVLCEQLDKQLPVDQRDGSPLGHLGFLDRSLREAGGGDDQAPVQPARCCRVARARFGRERCSPSASPGSPLLHARNSADREDAADVDATVARALGHLDVLEADSLERFSRSALRRCRGRCLRAAQQLLLQVRSFQCSIACSTSVAAVRKR